MTDEQLKKLAEITLMNSSLIGGLSTCCVSTLEQVLPLLPEKEGALALLHDIEQLQAAVKNLGPALALARKQLGLE